MKTEESINFDNLESIIDFAIEREIESAEFYQNLSKEVTSSAESEMIAKLAKEERRHRKLLETFKATGIPKVTEMYKFKWIRDLKRSDYLEDLPYHKNMTYKDPLILAMKREEKELALYNQLLDHAGTEESRKVFQILCQEEAKHKLRLEKTFDNYEAEMGD
jgi:rubrerythrin